MGTSDSKEMVVIGRLGVWTGSDSYSGVSTKMPEPVPPPSARIRKLGRSYALWTACQQSHDHPMSPVLADDLPVIFGRRFPIHYAYTLLMMKVTCVRPETVLHPNYTAPCGHPTFNDSGYFELHWSRWSGLWHHGWSEMPEGPSCTGVGLNGGGIQSTTYGSFTFISISTIHRS